MVTQTEHVESVLGMSNMESEFYLQNVTGTFEEVIDCKLCKGEKIMIPQLLVLHESSLTWQTLHSNRGRNVGCPGSRRHQTFVMVIRHFILS